MNLTWEKWDLLLTRLEVQDALQDAYGWRWGLFDCPCDLADYHRLVPTDQAPLGLVGQVGNVVGDLCQDV